MNTYKIRGTATISFEIEVQANCEQDAWDDAEWNIDTVTYCDGNVGIDYNGDLEVIELDSYGEDMVNIEDVEIVEGKEPELTIEHDGEILYLTEDDGIEFVKMEYDIEDDEDAAEKLEEVGTWL